MTIDQRIRQFITSNFYVANPAELLDTTSFLDTGIVDSTGVLELVGFLEQEFALTVADDEMLPENLDSIGNLMRFIAKKQSG